MNVTYPTMSAMDVLTVPATIEQNPELWQWCLEQTGATVIPAYGTWHGPNGIVTEESIVVRMLHQDIGKLRHVANVLAEMAAKAGESEVWAIPTRDVQVIVFKL